MNRNSRQASRDRGFTLVELLIVIAIIGILIGITLKVASYVNVRVAKARVAAQIQQVRQMLAEYYSVYGTYPPVSGVPFVYLHVPPDDRAPAGSPSTGLGCKTGLMYYLVYRLSPKGQMYYNPNPAGARWQHLMKGVEYLYWMNPTNSSSSVGAEDFLRRCHTLRDPWDQDYRYESKPPYQSYKLWCIGPNHIDDLGKGDDLGSGWEE